MSAVATYKGYTLVEAREELATWKEAKRAAATGKAYKIGSRELTRFDLGEINREVAFFAGLVDALESGQGSPVKVYARRSRW